MKTLQNFMEEMLLKRVALTDKKICGDTIIGRINENINAKLTIIENGYANHFSAIRLTIINKKTGDIDKQIFKFLDVWGKKPLTASADGGAYIWRYYDDIDWYGYRPTIAEYNKLAEVINDYISLYQ